MRRKVKIYMCSDTSNGKNLWKICVTSQWHFVTLIGNFNSGPISRNVIVSSIQQDSNPRAKLSSGFICLFYFIVFSGD